MHGLYQVVSSVVRSDLSGLGLVVNPVGHVPLGPSPQGKTMCQREVAIPLLLQSPDIDNNDEKQLVLGLHSSKD
jgi:hypothetical protein